MSAFKKILDEIGHLSLIISIPQLISAPVSVILFSILSPYPTPKDVIDVIDFLVISFPLTLAVAVITLLARTEEASFITYIGVIISAALLSNVLHNILSSAFPSIDISNAYHEAFDPIEGNKAGGSGMLVAFTMKIIGLYWKKFGIILFLQSCVIGIYAGSKYFKQKAKRPY